jgi:hypothetical protein
MHVTAKPSKWKIEAESGRGYPVHAGPHGFKDDSTPLVEIIFYCERQEAGIA